MAVDITINETIDSVDITVNPNIIEVNVTRTSVGVGGAYLPLAGGTMDAEAIIAFDNGSELREGTYNFGGSGGISRICSVGFEDMWQSGIRHVFDNNGLLRHSTNCFDIVPDSSFDNTLRFKVDSLWTLDSGVTYKCTDATTGAAVWVLYNTNIPSLPQTLEVSGRLVKNIFTSDTEQCPDGVYTFVLEDAWSYLYFIGNTPIDAVITDDFFDYNKGVELQGVVNPNGDVTIVWNGTSENLIINSDSQYIRFDGNLIDTNLWHFSLSTDTLGGGVPYTGATQDVNLGEFGLLTGNIEFDTTPTNIPTAAGSMVWNDTDGTLDLKLKGGNVTLQVGQEQVLRVVNKTATNINLLEANYQAVRVTGAQGQRLKVDLAQATTDTLSAETIGLVTETINNNQEGFITTSGLIRNVNTTGSMQSETWADGDILYLSPTTAGNLTKVKPIAPNHLVIIGYVVSAHATQGSIFVKVDNGYELDELHNVKIASAANGQALTYTSATDIWENKTIIQDSITDGVTTVAPSQNAVFDVLALKQNNLKTFNTTQGIYYFEEFMGSQAGQQNTNFSGVTSTQSGAGASCITTATITNRTNQQGVVRASTGTTLSGSAGFTYGGQTLFRGTGAITLETYTTIETLSTLLERFYNYFGYVGTGSAINPNNGIFFAYDEAGLLGFGASAASPNWKCVTINSTVRTFTITSIPVVAGQWYKLRININAASNSVEFYIDGVLVATHTTNIPTVATATSITSLITKTIGTTARAIQTDYFMYEEIFTTAR